MRLIKRALLCLAVVGVGVLAAPAAAHAEPPHACFTNFDNVSTWTTCTKGEGKFGAWISFHYPELGTGEVVTYGPCVNVGETSRAFQGLASTRIAFGLYLC